MAIGTIRREAHAGVGHRRDALSGSLADTVLLVLPTARGAAVAGGLASLIVVEFVPALHHQATVFDVGAWLVAVAIGALMYVYAVRLARHLLRNEPFSTTYSSRLATKLYLGYAVAAVVCSATQSGIHAVLDPTMAMRDDFPAAVARAATFFVLGPAINALLALRMRVREQERVLRERLRELERARAMLARADEMVRREAAEVLHGRVQSRLLAAQVRLERLAGSVSEHVASEIAATVAMLDDLRVNEVRATSHRLHPPAIRVGLLAAVRSLVATFEGSFHVEVDLRVAPGVLELDDPMRSGADEETRLVVYRALEEALTNAYRHGKATHVEAELSLLPGNRIQLRVADNGVGFANESFTVGLGVASVAARVEGRGGAWWVSSTPGEGTVFNAVVPMTKRLLSDKAFGDAGPMGEAWTASSHRPPAVA